MASKTGEILGHIIDIKQHLGNIDGHLKELNGRVNRNVEDIEKGREGFGAQDKRLDKVERRLAYYAGGIGVLLIFIQGVINYFM